MNNAAEMSIIHLIAVVCGTCIILFILMYNMSTVIIIVIIIVIVIIILLRRTNTCSYPRAKRVICLMGISVYNYTNISFRLASDDCYNDRFRNNSNNARIVLLYHTFLLFDGQLK